MYKNKHQHARLSGVTVVFVRACFHDGVAECHAQMTSLDRTLLETSRKRTLSIRSEVNPSVVSANVISSPFGIAFAPDLDPGNHDGTAARVLTPPGAKLRTGFGAAGPRPRGFYLCFFRSRRGKRSPETPIGVFPLTRPIRPL